METASLRIKFTPLLKESQKHHSKCLLEIVPEVSDIQNFEKLTWKKENSCIEYTVPMTYKIILRKQTTEADKDDEIIKTYYSCVDLLLSSSQSNYDLASGDVARMTSDTFILSKIPTNVMKKDYFISNFTDDVNYLTQSGTETYETLDLNDFKEAEDDVGNDGITNTTSQQDYVDNIELIVCDKNTNTNSVSAIYTYDVSPDDSVKKKTGLESNCLLNMSPMFSEKSQGSSQTIPRSTISKAVMCSMYNFQRDMMLMESRKTKSAVFKETPTRMIAELGDISRNTTKHLLFTSLKSKAPEIRIAQYIQYMETELLPLNTFLDQLITKCSVLGVNKSQCSSVKPSSNNLLYKSVSKCKDNKTETCENSISNRAVFSFVSED